MAKLIFRYGAMGSSKTANALMVRYNYLEKGKNVVILKPACENRDGEKVIRSRIGLEAECEFAEEFLDRYAGEPYDAIIVDEAQFLAPADIDRLSDWKCPQRKYFKLPSAGIFLCCVLGIIQR